MTYLKTLFLLMVLMASPFAQAGKEPHTCRYDQLMMAFMGDNQAQITGSLEVPHGGYSYTLTPEKVSEGTQQLTLTLKAPEQKGMGFGMVISQLAINETILVAQDTTRIFIDVIKPFNWGGEFYSAALKGNTPLCLNPDVYK